MARLNLRHSALDLDVPAAGPISVRFVGDVSSSWDVWVQPRGLPEPDLDEALAVFSGVVDGDDVVFHLAQCELLPTASTLVVMDGDVLLATGRVSRSMSGVDVPRETSVSIVLREATVEVTFLSPGGSGDVASVNGQTGVVVLGASDVGALPDDTPIPDVSGLVETTDPRLTDARTPTAHSHATSDVTGLDTALSALGIPVLEHDEAPPVGWVGLIARLPE